VAGESEAMHWHQPKALFWGVISVRFFSVLFMREIAGVDFFFCGRYIIFLNEIAKMPTKPIMFIDSSS
jgi:hypothetical protein